MAALEIAVARAGAELVADEFVGVHAETHRASRAAPFEASVAEDFGEAHALGDGCHALRAGDDDGFHTAADLAALDVAGDFLEIAQAAVCAAPEEGDIDFGALDRCAGLEMHVREGFFGGGAIFFRNFVRERNLLVDENGLSGIDAPGNGRGDVGGVVGDKVVVFRVGVRGGRLPARHSGLPIGALRRVGAAFEIFESRFIGIHIAHTRASLDRHVADRHALLLRESVECGSAVFIGEAESTIDPEFPDDVQNHIFRVNAGGEFSIHLDTPDLRLVKRHGLGGEDIADLAGADAEGDRTERTVRGGVGVAAGDRGAGLGDSLLGADDVDNALLAGGEVEKGDAVFRAVLAERFDHGIGEIVTERLHALVGRHDVIDGGEGAVRIKHLEPEVAKHAERLGAGDLVDEVGADQELRSPVGEFADGVCLPHLVE